MTRTRSTAPATKTREEGGTMIKCLNMYDHLWICNCHNIMILIISDAIPRVYKGCCYFDWCVFIPFDYWFWPLLSLIKFSLNFNWGVSFLSHIWKKSWVNHFPLILPQISTVQSTPTFPPVHSWLRPSQDNAHLLPKRKPQNHGFIKAGKDLQAHPVQPLTGHTMFAKPCSKVPHLLNFRALPEMVTPAFPWTACSCS